MSKCYIPHYPFLPYLCFCQGVVTSPLTGMYNNDASSGDAANELTLGKKNLGDDNELKASQLVVIVRDSCTPSPLRYALTKNPVGSGTTM